MVSHSTPLIPSISHLTSKPNHDAGRLVSQVRSATATGGGFFVPDRAAATAGAGTDCAAAMAGAGAALSAATARVGAERSRRCKEFATAAPNPPYFSSSLQMSPSDMLRGCAQGCAVIC